MMEPAPYEWINRLNFAFVSREMRIEESTANPSLPVSKMKRRRAAFAPVGEFSSISLHSERRRFVMSSDLQEDGNYHLFSSESALSLPVEGKDFREWFSSDIWDGAILGGVSDRDQQVRSLIGGAIQNVAEEFHRAGRVR